MRSVERGIYPIASPQQLQWLHHQCHMQNFTMEGIKMQWTLNRIFVKQTVLLPTPYKYSIINIMY